MKRREFLGASAVAGLSAVRGRQARAETAGSQQRDPQIMRAGYARVKITPPLGTTMMGFGSRDLAKGCTGIHDDVYIRALCLEQADKTVLIMGSDLCLIGRPLADRMKGAIGRKMNIGGRQILLNSSHNHVAPVSGTWYSADYQPQDRLYRNQLVEAAVQAACEARDAMKEVTLWTGVTRCSLPLSRRKPDGKGGILWAPNPKGTTYDRLPICLFKDRADQPVCLLFSVSCHPSIVFGWEISAEYPGAAIKRIDDHLGTACSLFLQGTAGDSNANVSSGDGEHWEKGDWEDVDRAGAMVAEPVIQAIDKGLTRVEPDLKSAYIEMRWPLEAAPPKSELETIAKTAKPERTSALVKWWWARRQLRLLRRGQTLPTAAPISAQGIKLGGGVRLFALEGEPVAEWGYTIEKFYGSGTTFPLGYSNGQGLYLPVSHMLPEGGYAVESYWEYGFPAKLAPGMEDIVQNTLTQMREQGIA